MYLPLPGHTRDFHPLEFAHAGRTKKPHPKKGTWFIFTRGTTLVEGHHPSTYQITAQPFFAHLYVHKESSRIVFRVIYVSIFTNHRFSNKQGDNDY